MGWIAFLILAIAILMVAGIASTVRTYLESILEPDDWPLDPPPSQAHIDPRP